jgi:FlaA1/EpsC-like NDP-sugar epimerase
MILRLKRYRLSLKLAIYSLPVVVFGIGWWLWMLASMALARPVLYPAGGHLTQILFGTLVWAFIAEHYRVTDFDELFRERTGARAASSASIATVFILLATLYFTRNAVFPRGLLICDVVLLLALTILVHAFFRILCRSRAHFAKATRLLVVGADEFAHDAAARLQRLSFARCEVAGFVRLPGQDISVNGH